MNRAQWVAIAHQLEALEFMVQALRKQVDAALASLPALPSIVNREPEKQEERPRHYGSGRPLSRKDIDPEPSPTTPTAA